MGDSHRARVTHQLLANKETVFAWIHRMRFHLNVGAKSEIEDFLQPGGRLERRQREKEIGHAVTPGDPLILPRAIPPVDSAFFSRLKRKASAHDRTRGQELLGNYVRTKVHVVVTVDATGGKPIQALKFLQLRSSDIFEGACKKRMINSRRKTVRPEKTSESGLVLLELGRNLRSGKRCCQVQVQAAVDAVLPRQGSGAFGPFHEDHRADGRNGPAKYALQGKIGVLAIPPPVVGIDNDPAPEINATLLDICVWLRVIASAEERDLCPMTDCGKVSSGAVATARPGETEPVHATRAVWRARAMPRGSRFREQGRPG